MLSLSIVVLSSSLMVSIRSSGLAVAGYPITLTCTALVTQGFSDPPTVAWFDTNGVQVLSGKLSNKSTRYLSELL